MLLNNRRDDDNIMIKIKCPCCGYYTHLVESEYEPLFEICEVCFWQYDAVAHDKPDSMIGANSVTLNEARENYKLFGVSERRFLGKGRNPFTEEFPRNKK